MVTTRPMASKKHTVRYFVAKEQPKGVTTPVFRVVQEYRYRGSKGIALLLTYADKGVAEQIALLLNSAKRGEV